MRRYLIISLLVLIGCSSDFTSITQEQHQDINNVLPAVIDARTRLVKGIDNIPIRQTVTLDISHIETSLRGENYGQCRAYEMALDNILAQVPPNPDISAIELMIIQVRQITG